MGIASNDVTSSVSDSNNKWYIFTFTQDLIQNLVLFLIVLAAIIFFLVKWCTKLKAHNHAVKTELKTLRRARGMADVHSPV